MATWTNIPDSVLEPGKPARSVDALALRDNPIAIAQGASGAPRIVANALASNSVTTVKIVNQNVTAEKLATGGNENTWVRARIGAGSTAGGTGTYAFVYRVTRSNSTGPVNFNGTVAGSTLRAASITVGNGSTPGSQADPVRIEYGNALSGTWRVMGHRIGMADADPHRVSLAVRIS